MDLQNFFQSKEFKLILKILGALIIALVIFQFGMFVGFHKAEFSFGWGDNYHRMFGGPRGGFLRDFQGRDFTSGHGIVGTVANISATNIIIKADDGKEKTINVNAKTSIKQGTADLKISDLKVDEKIVVIGNPNSDGSVSAEIIRVFDVDQDLQMPGAR